MASSLITSLTRAAWFTFLPHGPPPADVFQSRHWGSPLRSVENLVLAYAKADSVHCGWFCSQTSQQRAADVAASEDQRNKSETNAASISTAHVGTELQPCHVGVHGAGSPFADVTKGPRTFTASVVQLPTSWMLTPLSASTTSAGGLIARVCVTLARELSKGTVFEKVALEPL